MICYATYWAIDKEARQSFSLYARQNTCQPSSGLTSSIVQDWENGAWCKIRGIRHRNGGILLIGNSHVSANEQSYSQQKISQPPNNT
jgi:hypothetical protein